MVRRNSSLNVGPSSDASVLKTGDIIWAPYRRIPEWPSMVRCVYPKKVTYVFLPLPEEKEAKTPVFSCLPNKVHLFSPEDTLPKDANTDMQRAFEAAMNIVKQKGQTAPPRPRISTSSVSTTQQKQVVEAASGKKNGSKTVVGSEEGKTGSKASGSSQGRENEDSSSHPSKYVPSVGDIVWLNTTAHPAWPVLIRQATKKLVMVDLFPLTGKSERYPQSACEKFDLNDRSLAAAIKKERNRELKLALQSVQTFKYGEEDAEGSEKVHSEKNIVNDGKSANSEESEEPVEESEEINKEEEEEKIKMSDEIRSDTKTLKPVIDGASKVLDVDYRGTNEVINSSSLSMLAVAGSPSSGLSSPPLPRKRPPKDIRGASKEKKPKFSEEMKHLEEELASKLESLKRGDVAWVKCGRAGVNDKWPVIVSCSRSKMNRRFLGLCVVLLVSLFDFSPYLLTQKFFSGTERGQYSKNMHVCTASIGHQQRGYRRREISDGILKAAIEQADEIIEGKLDPLRTEKAAAPEGKAHTKENGWKNKEEKKTEIKPEELLACCISEECRRRLLSVWLGMHSSVRQANYRRPVSMPLHFELQIGNLLNEADASHLIDVVDCWVQKFREPEKSITRRLHYIVTVALPEALVYGISQVMHCSDAEANVIFEEAIMKDASSHSDEGSVLRNA
uniref:PWWP domain-containing protein n=1 Tax=Ascaris lumbricoides TaxID=6252 RepID=A0A9J2PYL4_ASCLU